MTIFELTPIRGCVRIAPKSARPGRSVISIIGLMQDGRERPRNRPPWQPLWQARMCCWGLMPISSIQGMLQRVTKSSSRLPISGSIFLRSTPSNRREGLVGVYGLSSVPLVAEFFSLVFVYIHICVYRYLPTMCVPSYLLPFITINGPLSIFRLLSIPL